MREAMRRTATDLTTVEIDGEVSAYNPDTDRVVMLNATASDVFALCDGTLDEAGIVDLLVTAYRADRDEVAAGVGAALQLLQAEGLVERGRVLDADRS